MFIKVKRSVCVSLSSLPNQYQHPLEPHIPPYTFSNANCTLFGQRQGWKREKTHRRPPWWPSSAPCRIPFVQQLELMESTDDARTHLGSSTQIDRPRRRLGAGVEEALAEPRVAPSTVRWQHTLVCGAHCTGATAPEAAKIMIEAIWRNIKAF